MCAFCNYRYNGLLKGKPPLTKKYKEKQEGFPTFRKVNLLQMKFFLLPVLKVDVVKKIAILQIEFSCK